MGEGPVTEPVFERAGDHRDIAPDQALPVVQIRGDPRGHGHQRLGEGWRVAYGDAAAEVGGLGGYEVGGGEHWKPVLGLLRLERLVETW